MKTTLHLAVTAVILSLSGVAEARPHHGHGYQNDSHYGQGYGQRPRPRMSVQARAQLRLRQLGYYRGPIDGDFGRNSKRALVRFQQDHRLPVTAWLDGRTQRALRL